jgi:ferric-dicitrate binding protein FerR (iron transport regulator)
MEAKKISNIERVIQNFIQGSSTSHEEGIIKEWIDKNPQNRKYLFQNRDLWDSLQVGSERFNKIELAQWLEMKSRIATTKHNFSKLIEVIKIAALVILTLGIGWMSHYLYDSGLFSNQQVQLKTVEAIKGQVKEVFLADGTHVWLNSDSRLTFPTDFTKNNRNVDLQGEAFFEVTANEKKPFFVKTKNHTVKVVGTKFNICQYPESNIIETALLEGKVKIITGNIIKDLLPGQQSSFNTETSNIWIGENDVEIYSAWKDGRYEFQDESIEKVFNIIERWWDVKIDYQQGKLKNERITGVLKRHKPVSQIFNLIEQLVPIEYKIENDVITIVLK